MNPHLTSRISAFLFLCACLALGQSFPHRVGVSHDGNQHDRDDIGAAAWDIAIFSKAGARLVHDDYANHLADNNPLQEKDVEASVLGSANRWYGSAAMCFNDQHNLQAAINSIVRQINASSASDRFYFLLAGPMEVAWRGIAASNPVKRQYCTVISHSTWNDNHTSSQMTHKWSDITKTGVKAIHIADQNGPLNCKTGGCWDWAKNSTDEKIRFLFSRMNVGVYGDISDAGMAWYAVTGLGDQGGNSAKLKAYFQGGSGTGGTTGVTGFTLINADTDKDIGSLANNGVVDFSKTGTRHLNVRADVSGSVGSVRFGYDGNAAFATENGAPFALAGNVGANYNSWSPAVGTHTLTATAYASANAAGNAGGKLTVSFRVTAGGAAKQGAGEEAFTAAGGETGLYYSLDPLLHVIRMDGDALTFNLPLAGTYRITLYNMAGAKLSQINGEGLAGLQHIALGNASPRERMYLVHLQSGDKSSAQRVIPLAGP